MNRDSNTPFATAEQVTPSLSEIESWLIRRLAEELQEDEAKFEPTARFASYGLDSISALVLTGELEDWLSLELPSTLVWDCPTVRDLALHLRERLQETAPLAPA